MQSTGDNENQQSSTANLDETNTILEHINNNTEYLENTIQNQQSNETQIGTTSKDYEDTISEHINDSKYLENNPEYLENTLQEQQFNEIEVGAISPVSENTVSDNMIRTNINLNSKNTFVNKQTQTTEHSHIENFKPMLITMTRTLLGDQRG